MGLLDFGKQGKANALVIHMEWACQRSHDAWYLRDHLTSATKALVKLRKARAEDRITADGWAYIAGMAQNLANQIAANGDEQLMGDARYIHDFACKQYEIQGGT
jgi:hypothetical protein